MKSAIDFLWETPPYCPTPACYVHGVPEEEHHVEGCPVYETTGQAFHRMGDAMRAAGEAIAEAAGPLVAALGRTRRGRLALLRWRIRDLFR